MGFQYRTKTFKTANLSFRSFLNYSNLDVQKKVVFKGGHIAKTSPKLACLLYSKEPEKKF